MNRLLTFGVMDVIIDGARNPGIAPIVFVIPWTIPAYLQDSNVVSY